MGAEGVGNAAAASAARLMSHGSSYMSRPPAQTRIGPCACHSGPQKRSNVVVVSARLRVAATAIAPMARSTTSPPASRHDVVRPIQLDGCTGGGGGGGAANGCGREYTGA